MRKTVRGELTVFFSLVFLLLLALVGAAMESVSIQVRKNEKRADASRAAESVFAEYQRDLLEKYGIFALEESYESGQISEQNVLNRLSFYGAENMDIAVIAIRYLTDNGGQEFYRQAVEYQKMKTGVSVVENVLDKHSVWEEKERLAEEYEKADDKTDEDLQQILQNEEQELPDEDNPLVFLRTLKSEAFLSLILPEAFTVSDKTLDSRDLLSEREFRKGYGALYEKEPESGDAVFFNLYILEKFGNAVNRKEDICLQYELEYLLEGKSSDRDNLEAITKKLCNIRFGINYAYLLTNQTMQAEAEALAGTIGALIAVPAIIPVLKQGILLTWSYGEAMMDIRTLLEGNKVALIKSQETWKLSLENLLDIKEHGLPIEQKKEEGGLTYEEYLQMLLLTKSKEALAMRALNLVEANISSMDGKSFFKADACITGAKFQMNCLMRRNVNYQFQVSYQYH